MLVFTALLGIITWCVVYVVRSGLAVRRLKKTSPSQLLREMPHVDFTRIVAAARGCTSGDSRRRQLTSAELFERLGGLDGIRRLKKNAAIMCDLSQYLALITPEERKLVQAVRADAEKIARTAFIVYWTHVLHLHGVKPPTVLAKLYVRLSANFALICDKMLDEFLTMSAESANITVRLRRASQVLSGELED